MIVDELVNWDRSGGTYAETVVIDQASPNAPSPRIQAIVRGERTAGSSAGTTSRRGRGDTRRV
jgi:hypothetical protein